jgi:hypothetical protein
VQLDVEAVRIGETPGRRGWPSRTGSRTHVRTEWLGGNLEATVDEMIGAATSASGTSPRSTASWTNSSPTPPTNRPTDRSTRKETTMRALLVGSRTFDRSIQLVEYRPTVLTHPPLATTTG